MGRWRNGWHRFCEWICQPPPLCPDCNGTGEPIHGYSEFMWWRAQTVEVCVRCHGSGRL